MILVALFAFLLFFSYARANTPYLSFSQSKKTYSDINLRFSFKYPKDFEVRKTKADKITYIDIYPALYKDKFEPKFIEIIVMPSQSNAPLGEIILDSFPDKSKRDIIRLIKNNADGVQINERSNINENSQLSYFRYGQKLYIVKFNKSYYDPKNPFVLVNNSLFEGTYLGIINSISFTPSR